jgi:hypothetical protein
MNFYGGGLYSIKYRDRDPLPGGDLYARGAYIKGGAYMLVYTVVDRVKANQGRVKATQWELQVPDRGLERMAVENQ